MHVPGQWQPNKCHKLQEFVSSMHPSIHVRMLRMLLVFEARVRGLTRWGLSPWFGALGGLMRKVLGLTCDVLGFGY